MKHNIETLTVILKAEIMRYKKEFDKALEQKEKDLADAKKGFIGDKLKQRIAEINEEFDKKIVNLRLDAIASLEEIEALKKQELGEVQGIDKATVEKINALRDIPISADEYEALMQDVLISSNYWAKRSLMHLASKNNIDVTETGIGATYSVKISVLSQLKDQFARVINNYRCADRSENMMCEHVYLSDNVLENAIKIYGGKVSTLTEVEKANNAWLTIKANTNDIDRAFAIGNCMRNAKTEENKDRLLYLLSTDLNVKEISLQLSGYYDEITDFRSNKAIAYEQATKAMQIVRSASSKEQIDFIATEQGENAFFKKMYNEEIGRNETLAVLMNPTQPETTGAEAE